VRARRCAALLLSATVLTTCGTDGGTDGGPEEPSGGDAAGRATCSRFRDLSFDAFGETLSERQIVAGLREVGDLAADSTTPAIRDNGVAVGEEANAATLISGEPNPAQDALAESCNSAFPL
jgi:hypothetical protein